MDAGVVMGEWDVCVSRFLTWKFAPPGRVVYSSAGLFHVHRANALRGWACCPRTIITKTIRNHGRKR